MKNKKALICIFLLSIIISSCFKIGKDADIIFLAYSDGVISGAKIIFYSDSTFEYCSLSLLGEECYSGEYVKNENDILLDYHKEVPSIKAVHLKIKEDKLEFQDENGNYVYSFYIAN